jgi:type I restriction enzyme S subunit
LDSDVPVGELIGYSIGGGWGDEHQTPSSDTPVYVVRGADFPSFSLPKRVLPIRWESSKRAQKRYLKPGDIVLENSGGTKDRPTGRTIFITQQNCLDNLIPASFCRLIHPNQALVVPRYLYYWLQEMYQAGRTWNYQNQSTGISNFQYDLFAKSEYVRLPSREEQIAIAKVLGDIDDLLNALALTNDYLAA